MINFLELLLWGIVKLFNMCVSSVIVTICTAIMSEDFSPSLDTFYTYLGAENIARLLGFSKTAGYIIIFIIFALSMTLSLFSLVKESKDKIYSLFLRCVMAIITLNLLVIPDLSNHKDNGYINGILTVGEKTFQLAASKLGTNGTDGDELLDEERAWGYKGEEAKKKSALEALLQDESFEELDRNLLDVLEPLSIVLGPLSTPIVAWRESVAAKRLVVDIIKLGLLFTMATSVLELAYDMVRRYVNYCGLYICTPAACGLIAGYSSLDVFFKFMTMFVCELGMMSFCRIWLATTIFLMGAIEYSLIGLLFINSWALFGRNIDKLLNKIGLSTASTGGALALTSVAMGAGAIGLVKNTSGKGLGYAGAFTGIDALSVLGGIMDKNVKNAGSRAHLQEVDESPLSKLGKTVRSKANPEDGGLSKNQARRMMDDLNSPNMRNISHFEDMYRGLDEPSKNAFNNALKANNSQLGEMLGREFGFDVTDANKNGVMFDLMDTNKNEKIAEGRIANEKDDSAIKSLLYTDNNGHKKWANFYTDKNTMPHAGDSTEFTSEDLTKNREAGKPFNTPDEAKCGYSLNDIIGFDASKGKVTRIKTDTGCQFFQGEGNNRKMIAEQVGSIMHSKGSIFSNDCLNVNEKSMPPNAQNRIKAEMFDNQFYKAGEVNGFGHVVETDGIYAGKFGGQKPIASQIKIDGDNISAIIADRKYCGMTSAEYSKTIDSDSLSTDSKKYKDIKSASEQKYVWHAFDQDNPARQHKYTHDNDLLGSVYVTCDKPRSF